MFAAQQLPGGCERIPHNTLITSFRQHDITWVTEYVFSPPGVSQIDSEILPLLCKSMNHCLVMTRRFLLLAFYRNIHHDFKWNRWLMCAGWEFQHVKSVVNFLSDDPTCFQKKDPVIPKDLFFFLLYFCFTFLLSFTVQRLTSQWHMTPASDSWSTQLVYSSSPDSPGNHFF